jgi:hypothetical protein
VQKQEEILAPFLTSRTVVYSQMVFRHHGKQEVHEDYVVWLLTSGTAGHKKAKSDIHLPMTYLTVALHHTFLKPFDCAILNIAGAWNAQRPGFSKKCGSNQQYFCQGDTSMKLKLILPVFLLVLLQGCMLCTTVYATST